MRQSPASAPHRGGVAGRRALRRDRHRHRRGRRDARPPAGSDRQAGAAARARRLPAARAGQLGLHARCSSQGKYRAPEFWLDRHGDEFPPEVNYYVGGNTKFYGAALFRLRPRGLRRAAPPRRHLAGLADRLRRPRAVLHRRPSTSTWCTAGTARTRPRGRRARRTIRAGRARAADPAAQRRPGEAGAAPVPPADRREPDPGRARPGDPRQRLHPVRPGRRVPVPGPGQVRRAGHLRRPGAAPRQRRDGHQRLRGAAGDRRHRPHRHRRGHQARRRLDGRASAPTSSWSPAAR